MCVCVCVCVWKVLNISRVILTLRLIPLEKV